MLHHRLLRISNRVLPALVVFTLAIGLIPPLPAAPEAEVGKWVTEDNTKNQPTPGPALVGEAALQQLKAAGHYSSLAAALQAARYQARDQEDALVADNPTHRFNVRFDADGFQLAASSGSQTLHSTWQLAAVGYGPARITVPAGQLHASGPRMELRREQLGLTEWLHNSSAGLEHGFDLHAPVAPNPTGAPLHLELHVAGDLLPFAADDGQALILRDPDGDEVLSYESLKVWDADGTVLPAAMSVQGRTVSYQVDDRQARYPITIDPTFVSTQEAYLKAGDTDAGDEFGYSVAISGDTVVVGAVNEDSNATGINGDQTNNSANGSGAAYVFVRSDSTWSQQAYLKASNTGFNDNFGWSVAIAGDTVVVSAPYEDSNATGVNGDQTNNSANDSGAAYVFVRSGSTWSQQAYLKASNPDSSDSFGWSLAISGDTIVVGAVNEDSNAAGINGDQANNSVNNTGAAYVFFRSGSTWSQQAYLKASNPDASDFFGESVAISGNTIVVGAFNEDGNATGINGDQTNNSAGNAGAAYVFVRSVYSTWTQQAYLKASNTASHDNFGDSVAISSHTIVVGAKGEDSSATGINGDQTDNSAGSTGAAYVFTRSGVTWSQQAYLKASNTEAFDEFGYAVAISGDTVVVGARYEDSNATGLNGTQINNLASSSGAAYVFTRSDSTWSQQVYLKASNTGASDFFGESVAVSDGTVVVGARYEDSNASGIDGDQTNNSAGNAGAVYVFAPPPPNSAPTDIALSNSSVAQSSGYNVTVGTLSTTDTDSGDTHTYTLVSGTGDTDNASFNISGSTLQAYDAYDLAAGSHTVRIQTEDSYGATYQETFTITVVDDVPPEEPPSIPDLAVDSDSGASATDNITSDTAPIFAGTAEPNSTVTLTSSVDGSLGSTTADSTANWSFTANALTANTSHDITATATDAAGNTSRASLPLTITIDTIAPVITSAGTTSFTYGASPDYTISASGSPDSFGAGGLLPGLSVNSTTGELSGTPIAAGEFTSTLTATDLAGNTGNASLIITVNPKALTITGLISPDKVYDGTTNAPYIGTPSLSGVVGNDSVSIDDSGASATFADRHVGNGKMITTSGFTLTGDEDGNYTLIQPTLVSDVTPREITTSGLVALDKVYDGTDTATIDYSSLVLNGVQGEDTLAIDSAGASAVFNDKTIGTGKAVTITEAALSGADAGNYTLALPTDLTADITAAGLTVTGAAVTTKAYDATTTATLDFSGASLVGTQGSDDVSLNSTSASGSYATAGAGTGIAVTVSGLALDGTDAGNYTLTQPGLTGDITPATATITLADLSQTYTGNALTPTATTTPSGLNVTLTYDDSSTAPTNAGAYTLAATIVEDNYQGSSSDTFEIAKADQTVSMTHPGTLTAGLPTTLAATASSGLDVTFSLDAGSGTLVDNVLTPSGTDAITITAAQAGDNNRNAAETTVTITNILKQSQTITFGALEDKRANDGDFDLSATATSGLDVTFTIVSGPAMLTGNTVSMTGATGTVTVRADQAGNAIYDAASAVTRTFEVTQSGPLVFFGTADDGTAFAVNIPEGQSTGTLFGTIPNGQYYILTFQTEDDNSITPLDLQILGDPSTTAASLARSPLRARVGRGIAPPIPQANFEFTFTGTITGGRIDFQIAELGITLTGEVEPPEGPTADIAGLYESSSINNSSGTTSSIVGTTGRVYVLAVTPDVVTGAAGTIESDGSFAIETDEEVIIQGEVDAPTTTVSGTLILPSGEEDDFEGLSTQTLRTDRLINLSTRAFVDVAEGADLVTGFVIGGPEPKRVLLRAVGPTLAAFGITQALPDPQVTIYDGSGNVVAEVDDWGGHAETAAAMALTGAFTLATDSLDAAHVTELDPGVYTMRVANNSEAGITLAEIYDASENPNSQYQRLVNISSRGRVVGGQGVLVGGFIVTGNSPKRVLVRGVGPGLADYGVVGALADPLLKVYNANEQVIAINDDWETPVAMFEGQRTATGAEITTTNSTTGAFALDAGSSDAALVITLSPGLYTVELSSGDNQPGTALIEVYEIPEAAE